MNIDLIFQNWQLVLDGASVRQFDDGAQALSVTGERPAGWRWRMDIAVYGKAYFNSVPLTETAGALTAVLTRGELAFGDTAYTLQLVGEREGVTRHTNPVRLYVGESICGDAVWPEVPASFTAAQRGAEAAAAVAEAAAARAEAAASDCVQQSDLQDVERAIDSAAETLRGHEQDAVVHITAAERAAWNAKLDAAGIPTRTSELENDSGYQTAAQVQAAAAGKADKEPRVAMTAQDTTAALEPNRLYVFPDMSALTITLAAPADSTVVNEYHFIFGSGATPTTLTIPATINQPDGFTVEANHVYEVSIMEGCMTAQGWAVSA